MYAMKGESMNFEYKEYVLRKAEAKDAQELLKITNDDEIMKYYGESGAHIKDEEEALMEINWNISQFDHNAGMWVITKKTTDEYIGDIGFNKYIKAHNKVEVGYKLKKEYWGEGIITNFLNQLINYGFTELNYNRIEALVDVNNFASKRVLLKNGFSLEGVLRDYEFEYGHYVDLEMYSIIKRTFNR